MFFSFGLVLLVILLALVQYTFFIFMAGRARERTGVAAPAITGNEEFERYYRVQMNSVELLVAFIPAMLIGAMTLSIWLTAVLGLVYLIGRQLYYHAYVTEPKQRGLGFMLSLLPIIILLVGSIVSVIKTWVDAGFIPLQ
jgi:glutathione S-transferase